MNPTWTVTTRTAGRRRPDVLVLDAHYRQALASMRSLSRAGLVVGAIACRSRENWAPALHSRWCRFRAVVPDVTDRADDYVNAVLELLDEYPGPDPARRPEQAHRIATAGKPLLNHRGQAGGTDPLDCALGFVDVVNRIRAVTASQFTRSHDRALHVRDDQLGPWLC